MTKGIGGHTHPVQGNTNVWLTPKGVIDALGPFDLDPRAATPPRPWPTARKHIIEAEDGLSHKWEGFTWCNPPYGLEAEIWVERLSQHGDGLALVFARTETSWFQRVVLKAQVLFFPGGRFTFCRPDGTPSESNAGGPSVFLAFGDTAVKRLERWALYTPGFFAALYSGEI